MNNDQAAIAERIAELEELELVFVVPGWSVLEREIAERLEDLTDAVMQARPQHMSAEEVEQKRGQARELRWMRDKPQQVAEELREKRQQLTEAAQDN